MDRFKFEENFEFVCRCFESLSDTEDLMPYSYVRKLRKKIWQNSGFSGFQARTPKKVNAKYREVLAEKVEKHKETDSDVSKVEPVEKIAESDEINKLSEAEADISEQAEETTVSDEIEVKES